MESFGRGLFGGLFDFNGDGEESVFESSLGIALLAGMEEEMQKQQEAESLFCSTDSWDDSNDTEDNFISDFEDEDTES